MFRVILLILLLVSFVGAIAPGRVYWRGMVDQRVQLVIQANTLQMKTLEGREYPEGVHSFTASLPAEPVAVNVKLVKGRGQVRVIEQPGADNDFAAVIELYDDKGGAKEYQIEIFWE